MGQFDLIDIFVEHPTRAFTIREISNITGIGYSSTGTKLRKIRSDPRVNFYFDGKELKYKLNRGYKNGKINRYNN